MSKRQRVECSCRSRNARYSCEKSASDDVRPDFGCHEWFLSQGRFNRPAGTGLFFFIIPGTSCLATIVLSLRDKIHSTAEVLLKLALWG
jgi:hypothetical protein